MSGAHKAVVLSRYKELLRLIDRLPSSKKGQALIEAKSTVRSRRSEEDPQKQLDHLRELVSKIGYLRIATPKQPGEVSNESGVYVVRDGKLVEGSGAAKGARVADGTTNMDDAVRRNARDFKRFYGAEKPKNVFF